MRVRVRLPLLLVVVACTVQSSLSAVAARAQTDATGCGRGERRDTQTQPSPAQPAASRRIPPRCTRPCSCRSLTLLLSLSACFCVCTSLVSLFQLPDFLAETASVRAGNWRGPSTIPADLTDRRVEITGPVDRKMIINALNSGAKVFMADFEGRTQRGAAAAPVDCGADDPAQSRSRPLTDPFPSLLLAARLCWVFVQTRPPRRGTTC